MLSTLSTVAGAASKVRLVLVDDHHLFREGLRAVIATQSDMIIVGEAPDGAGALEIVERTRPDLTIVDVSLPQVSGLEVAREIIRRSPLTKVLILTMHRVEDYVDEALRAGAMGFASKSQPPDAIMAAIRRVARGELYLAEAQTEAVPPPSSTNGQNGDPVAILSKRESEIFVLVVRGLSNENLARRLCISIKTVETHRASINRKLGVHSTAELVRFAARNGLLSPA